MLDDALVLELPIDLGDRVGIDHELLRKRPNPRKLLAGSQGAGLDRVLHLLHQLQIDRNARRGIGAEEIRQKGVSELMGLLNCTTEISQ